MGIKFLSAIKIVILFVISGIGYPGYAKTNYPYINPTPGEISIIAYTPIPDGLEPTRQAYMDVVDCGFNLATQRASLDYYKKQMQLASGLNFKFIISNPGLRTEKSTEFIKTFKDSVQLGGWYFYDEPPTDELKTLKISYDNLFREDPKHLILLNLWGGLVGNMTKEFSSYYEYLETIETLFTPPLWSYDLYPIAKIKGEVTVRYDVFYDALESIMAISKKTSRPFWNHCLSMAIKNRTMDYPAATEVYLRFQIFSSLGYGAQGIGYFTYGQRKSTATSTYSSALVNLDGKKTDAWKAARKVNNEVKSFNYLFYQCNIKEVRHTGSKIYKNTKRLSGGIGPFQMIRSQDEGVQISYIENNGEYYVMLVNHDIFNKQKVSIDLKPNKKVLGISGPYVNKNYDCKKNISVTLDPGGYVIFKEN